MRSYRGYDSWCSLDKPAEEAFDAEQQAIRDELAKREHIPNKVESKEARRKAAGYRPPKKKLKYNRKGRLE